MISPKGKRIFAWAMAVLMALMLVAPTAAMLVHAEDFSEEKDQIADLNKQYQELQKKQQEIQAQLQQTQNKKQQELAVRNQIDAQIQTTQAQVDTLNERIALLEKRMEQKEEEMADKQKEIDKNFDLYKQRMRAMYMSGGTSSTIGMVLGAQSYSEVLMRSEVVSRVARHDQQLIETLNTQKSELQKIKDEIEDDKSQIEDDKKEQESKKVELNTQFQAAQSRIQDIASMEKEFLANKEENQKRMKAVQAEIDQIYAEINRNSALSEYIGGEMLWPAATLTQITSPYGSRFGGSDFHTGMDISGAGAYGAPIRAANTGTVAFVGFSAGGYGNYLIIDHGGGITTLYGHCSSVDVKKGQTVTVGQTIARVGSTGWSTGPHVHFEVRVNGKYQNPASYLKPR